MTTDFIVVLCTAPAGGDIALELGRGLVAAGLAACVNLLPAVRSIYRWQGEIQDEQEVQLLIKTRAERFAEVEQWLRAHHPYEVPEVVALPVVFGAAPYLDWVSAQVPPA